MFYVYVNHLDGSVYMTNGVQEDLYCEMCGDSDWLHEVFESEEEANAYVEDYNRVD